VAVLLEEIPARSQMRWPQVEELLWIKQNQQQQRSWAAGLRCSIQLFSHCKINSTGISLKWF